jgi:hypothetical protein
MSKALESPLAPLAELTRQNMEMWARMQSSMLAAMNPQPAAAPPGGDTPQGEEPSGT